MGSRPCVHLAVWVLYVLFIFIAVFPGFYAGPGGGHCPAQGQAPAKLRGEEEARGQRGGRVLLRGRVTEVRLVTRDMLHVCTQVITPPSQR